MAVNTSSVPGRPFTGLALRLLSKKTYRRVMLRRTAPRYPHGFFLERYEGEQTVGQGRSRPQREVVPAIAVEDAVFARVHPRAYASARPPAA